VDDLSVTPARQSQSARERFARVGAFTRIAFTTSPSRIITPTMIRAITVAIPIASLVVVLLDSMRVQALAHRDRVVTIGVALVSLAWIAFVGEITRIEVHRTPPVEEAVLTAPGPIGPRS
jgi:hypothetical protein